MLGPFPRAVLIACTTMLRWLLLATAGLLAVLIVVQQVRGDEGAAPVPLAIAAVAMAFGGWISGRAALWLERQ